MHGRRRGPPHRPAVAAERGSAGRTSRWPVWCASLWQRRRWAERPRRVRHTIVLPGRSPGCGAGLRRAGIDLADRAWWGEGMATPAAFVGREDELSRLLAALANQTRMVLVVGDAGVGKTRLAGEAVARAAGAGEGAAGGASPPLGEHLPVLPGAAALDVMVRLSRRDMLES